MKVHSKRGPVDEVAAADGNSYFPEPGSDGEVFDVPTDVGNSLLEQVDVWERHREKQSKRTEGDDA